MKPSTKAKLQKFFRVTHGWLGVIVFPWIFVIGMTGLYLNHKSLVLDWIATFEYDESEFADWPNPTPPTMTDALLIAQSIWPDEEILSLKEDTYHGFDVFSFKKDSGKIMVTQDTGHYYSKSNLSRVTYAPDGTVLDRKIYWKSVFKWLHARGWLNNGFGTWLADITAGAMMIFSLTGLWIFFAPRTKRIGRRIKKIFRIRPAPAAAKPMRKHF